MNVCHRCLIDPTVAACVNVALLETRWLVNLEAYQPVDYVGVPPSIRIEGIQGRHVRRGPERILICS